jgi:tRNA-specific 2-thiouridylase
MSGLKVLAAMSGGVDSATAAARAVDAGLEVTGVHLALSRNPSSYRTGARGCCTLEDARDARRAADVIGIPFYVWDMAERFHRDVVEDFVAEYAAGRTPNPCLRCNEKIKFAAVLDKALALGFDAVCTGHYARIRDGILYRAADPGKDQSYVLAVLTREQIAHAMFPLGDTPKAEVRAEAARRGLAVADKPDSHDVCFIADGDTRGFLTKQLGTAPGRIVDQSGAVLGQHDGAYAFTVGQRRGLRVGTPAGDGKPRYVLDIEPVTRTVTVGPAEGLDVIEITATRPVWTGCDPSDPSDPSAPPGEPRDCLVQLRAHGEVHACTAWLDGDEVRIRLGHPARGIANGQAAVLYDGDMILGSATIASTSRAVPVPDRG